MTEKDPTAATSAPAQVMRSVAALDVSPEERAEINAGAIAALEFAAQILLLELEAAPPDRKNFVRAVFHTQDGGRFSLVLQREGAKTPLDLAGEIAMRTAERDAARARADLLEQERDDAAAERDAFAASYDAALAREEASSGGAQAMLARLREAIARAEKAERALAHTDEHLRRIRESLDEFEVSDAAIRGGEIDPPGAEYYVVKLRFIAGVFRRFIESKRSAEVSRG